MNSRSMPWTVSVGGVKPALADRVGNAADTNGWRQRGKHPQDPDMDWTDRGRAAAQRSEVPAGVRIDGETLSLDA